MSNEAVYRTAPATPGLLTSSAVAQCIKDDCFLSKPPWSSVDLANNWAKWQLWFQLDAFPDQTLSDLGIFKESALGRFFHRVAMSVYVYIYLSIFLSVPISCNFFAWGNWCMRPSSENWCTRPLPTLPSYYTRGALKTRGGCRASIGHASIGHASILLHAWSPKNEGWVQSVHRPRVHLITRVEP